MRGCGLILHYSNLVDRSKAPLASGPAQEATVGLAQSMSEAGNIDLTLGPARRRIAFRSISSRALHARTVFGYRGSCRSTRRLASAKHCEALLIRPPRCQKYTHSGVSRTQSNGHITLILCNFSRFEFRCRCRWLTLLEVTAVYAAIDAQSDKSTSMEKVTFTTWRACGQLVGRWLVWCHSCLQWGLRLMNMS
jgi:hypothetical protein